MEPDRKSLGMRMKDVLNGPAPPKPQMPVSTSFMSAAEEEIRREVTRRHQMLAELEELKTDVDMYRQRAQLAEAEVERQTAKINFLEDSKAAMHKNLSARISDLENTITAINTKLESSAQMILSAFDITRGLATVQKPAIADQREPEANG